MLYYFSHFTSWCNAMFTFIYFHCLYFYVCSISFHVFCCSLFSLSSVRSLVGAFMLSAFSCVLNILRQIYINSFTHTHSWVSNVVDAIHSHSMRVERCEYKPIHGLPFVYSARDHTKQAMSAVAAAYKYNKAERQRDNTRLTISTCMTSLL